MKKINLIAFTALMLAATQGYAKYNQPADVAPFEVQDASYMFSYMDKDGDGKLTLEEYKSKRMTRDVEREIRREKKEGIYKTPEEEFAIMDNDNDGLITLENFANYLKSKRK